MFRNAGLDSDEKRERKRLNALRLDLMKLLLKKQAELNSTEKLLDRLSLEQTLAMQRADELKGINDPSYAILHLEQKIYAAERVLEAEHLLRSRQKIIGYVVGVAITVATLVAIGIAATVGVPIIAALIVTSAALLVKIGVGALVFSPFLSLYATLTGSEIAAAVHASRVSQIIAEKHKLTQLKNYLSATSQEHRHLRMVKQGKTLAVENCQRQLTETTRSLELKSGNPEASRVNAQLSVANSLYGFHAPQKQVGSSPQPQGSDASPEAFETNEFK